MSTLDYLASLCLVADLFSLGKNLRQTDAHPLFAKSPNPLQNLVTIELDGFMVRLRVRLENVLPLNQRANFCADNYDH